MDETNKKSFNVYAVIEKGQKSFWKQCGIGFVNHDQSINLYLDMLPINGKLQIRERDENRDRWSQRKSQEQPPAEVPAATSFDFGAIQ